MCDIHLNSTRVINACWQCKGIAGELLQKSLRTRMCMVWLNHPSSFDSEHTFVQGTGSAAVTSWISLQLPFAYLVQQLPVWSALMHKV